MITAGWVKPSETAEKVSFWSFINGTSVFISLLILTVLLQFAYLIYERKQYGKKEENLSFEIDVILLEINEKRLGFAEKNWLVGKIIKIFFH